MDSVIGFGPVSLGSNCGERVCSRTHFPAGSLKWNTHNREISWHPKKSERIFGNFKTHSFEVFARHKASRKMEHPIVQKILKEGINSVNISMLDESAQKKILGDAGEKLYKQGKFVEAIEIMAKANDMEKLTKLGDMFLSENKTELATLCFIPTKNKQRLNDAAVLCIKSKNYKLAAKAYEAADNKQMASFIRQNFVEV